MRLDGVPVVVTGGAGYVGAAVAHGLARAGARVTVVDNLAFGHRAQLGALPLIEADVRDEGAMARALGETGALAVCHLAALANIPDSFAHPEQCMDVNVGGTRALVAAAHRAHVQAFVYASTCAVYAPAAPG